ncbi:MAG: hypothetical protein ACI8RZ_000693 [Myxococcota bacterium]|jgi:hypothetical protein
MNALGIPAAEAARVLSGLSEGERAWFWWRAGSQAALLLQPLSLDPTMARLKAQISGITLVNDAQARSVRPVSGILQVGQGGRIGLLSAANGAGVLPALAGWVVDHHADHPDLIRLHRAQFYETGSTGTISAIFEDDALWADIPAPEALDDTTRAAAVLKGLGEGERAWAWMARTSGGRGVMIAGLVSEDADGERFTARVRALRLGGGAQDVVQGVARREGKNLTLTSSTMPSHWTATVAALLGQSGDLFKPLRRARLVHLTDGMSMTSVLPPHRELSKTTAVLRAQKGGWFWFTTATLHGQPLLVLRTDREALKNAAQQAGGAGRTIRGKVRFVEDRIELQTKDADDLWAALLDWAKKESRRWPDLRRLRGVRITKIEP